MINGGRCPRTEGCPAQGRKAAPGRRRIKAGRPGQWALLLALCGTLAATSAGADALTVCALDSGSSLPGAEGWNYLEDNQNLTDAVGHGDIIHALLKEGAPQARVYMLKCFEAEGSFDETAVLSALYDAVDQYRAQVIVMCWTITGEREALREAVRYAANSGAVLVAPAGNLGPTTGLGDTVYPAAWEEVIGVGGVNLNAMGQVEKSLWYLSGEAVYVCANARAEGERGSSFAAARVAACIADFLQKNTGSTEEAVRQMLRSTAQDVGAPGYDITYGWGYIAE